MLSSAAGLLTDQSFLSVFCAAMLTIGIGWGLRKKNILKAEIRPVLNALLLKLTVPCLAFDAFMTDFARGELRRNVQILLISFVLYLSMIALSQLIFIKYGRRKANLYGICFAIGQQTLYAMPILRAIYRENPSESMLSASMVAIAFRVMLYLYAFYSISGVAVTGGSLKQNLKKAFLTPVMLAMFAGFFIWLTQGLLPCPGGIPLLRLDLRFPALYAVVPQMATLVNPLAMLLIGSTLGESQLGDALRDGKAWFIASADVYSPAVYPGDAVPAPADRMDPLYRGDADDGGDVLCCAAFCSAVHLLHHLPGGSGYGRTGVSAFHAVLCPIHAALLLPGEGRSSQRSVSYII